MPLLDVYDHHVLGRAGRPDDLAEDRAKLLRQRLAARLVPALGDGEHSIGVPTLGGFCERAFQLYVQGFPEQAIVEAHARVASLARAWLARRGVADGDAMSLGEIAGRLRAAGALAPDDDVAAGLAALDARRAAVDERDRDLARSIVSAAERAGASGGLAAVRAESPTSQRLRWNADLHDLLAVVALTCARILAAVAADAHG